jgi:hypothetical protein
MNKKLKNLLNKISNELEAQEAAKVTKPKSKRGGARPNSGAKKLYSIDMVTTTIIVPADFLSEIRSIAKSERDKYKLDPTVAISEPTV